jgi:hypothetical protein
MTPTPRTIVSLAGLPTNPVAISTYRLAELLAIEQEIVELRADKARLDWLQQNMNGSFGPAFSVLDECPVHTWTFDAPACDSVRDAIDAVMEGDK